MRTFFCREILFINVLTCLFYLGTSNAAPQLVAHWSFDSVSGSTYYDITGKGFDAVGTGTGLSAVSGAIGDALNCSGTQFDCAVVNSRDSFALQNFTIECWYNMTSLPVSGSQGKIFDYSYIQSGVRNGYSLLIKDQGTVDLGVSSNSGSTWLEAVSKTKISIGKWYHLAATYNGSYMRVYVNGILEGSLSYSGGILKANSDARIGCQKRMDGSVAFFGNGKIDELKLYNFALTSDTISAIYHALFPAPVLIPYTPNPTYNQKPLLQWHANRSIEVYRIEIATNRQFTSPIVSLPTNDTFFTPTVNLPVGEVYWRVGNDADMSIWSETSSLTIQDHAVPILIPCAPDPTRNRKPLLLWRRVEDATSYNIQINISSSFTSPLMVDAVTDTQYVPTVNLPVAVIYWRVKSNLSSDYSSVDTVTIINDSIPCIIPMTPDTQYIARPKFCWHPGVGALSHRIQIDTIGNFLNAFISVPVEDTMYSPTVDLPEGRIFWRVSANTNPARYSETDTFWIDFESSINPGLCGEKRLAVSAVLQPLQHGVSLTYTLDRAGAVSLRIYSIDGNRMADLKGRNTSAGRYTMIWNGSRKVPAGTYCAVCKINGETFSKRIILLR